MQVRGVTAQDVRNRVVEEMRRDWPSYKPFVDPELHADYLADMARPTEYAGEPELVALSKVYGVTIRVWGADAAHDRDIRALSVGAESAADAPVVHLAHRSARNFRDHYFAVQLPARSQVRSRPIMLRLRGSLRRMPVRGSRCVLWQEKVESVAAHEDAMDGMDGSVLASSLDDQTAHPHPAAPSTPRNAQLDVAAPSPGARLIGPVSAQSSGSSCCLARIWLASGTGTRCWGGEVCFV